MYWYWCLYAHTCPLSECNIFSINCFAYSNICKVHKKGALESTCKFSTLSIFYFFFLFKTIQAQSKLSTDICIAMLPESYKKTSYSTILNLSLITKLYSLFCKSKTIEFFIVKIYIQINIVWTIRASNTDMVPQARSRNPLRLAFILYQVPGEPRRLLARPVVEKGGKKICCSPQPWIASTVNFLEN